MRKIEQYKIDRIIWHSLREILYYGYVHEKSSNLPKILSVSWIISEQLSPEDEVGRGVGGDVGGGPPSRRLAWSRMR